MTAKQELREFVDNLSDAAADQWLAEIRQRDGHGNNGEAYALPDGSLDIERVLRLSVKQRASVLTRWEAETDVALLADVAGADIDVERLIDE